MYGLTPNGLTPGIVGGQFRCLERTRISAGVKKTGMFMNENRRDYDEMTFQYFWWSTLFRYTAFSGIIIARSVFYEWMYIKHNETGFMLLIVLIGRGPCGAIRAYAIDTTAIKDGIIELMIQQVSLFPLLLPTFRSYSLSLLLSLSLSPS